MLSLMKKALIGLMLSVTALNSFIISVGAHPGRLNSSGCHNDRRNGTGYHCHNTSPVPYTPQPVCRDLLTPSFVAVSIRGVNGSILESGPMLNYKETRSKLQGNNGILGSYTINSLPVRVFVFDSPEKIGSFSLGNDKQWLSIVRSEEQNKSYTYFIAANNFGVDNVLIEFIDKKITAICN